MKLWSVALVLVIILILAFSMSGCVAGSNKADQNSVMQEAKNSSPSVPPLPQDSSGNSVPAIPSD